jgi:cytochrome c
MSVQKFAPLRTISKGALVLALVAASRLWAGAAEDEGLKLMQGSDCFSCHSVDNKIVGPAYKDVAKKYKGAGSGAIAKLVAKVKAGGSGNWGAVPMAAHPQFTDDQLDKMVRWVLSVKPGMQAGAAAAAPAPVAAAPAPAKQSAKTETKPAVSSAPPEETLEEAEGSDDTETDVSKLMEKHECFGCHLTGQDLPWPDLKKIAQTYKGKPGVIGSLVKKLKEGGAGRWGKIPQVPYSTVSEANLTRMVSWMIENGETYTPAAAGNAGPALDPDKMSGFDLVKASDCLSCHSVDQKVVGPAYKDVAKKYHGATPEVIATLVKKVKTGGSGNWGAVPMASHPNIPDKTLEKMVKWVLEQ